MSQIAFFISKEKLVLSNNYFGGVIFFKLKSENENFESIGVNKRGSFGILVVYFFNSISKITSYFKSFTKFRFVGYFSEI
jgi:hypothetical protein